MNCFVMCLLDIIVSFHEEMQAGIRVGKTVTEV